jgi:hypothetical protein
VEALSPCATDDTKVEKKRRKKKEERGEYVSVLPITECGNRP